MKTKPLWTADREISIVPIAEKLLILVADTPSREERFYRKQLRDKKDKPLDDAKFQAAMGYLKSRAYLGIIATEKKNLLIVPARAMVYVAQVKRKINQHPN